MRVVRAAPGSGKTWLVAEAIKKELESWKGPGGVAALSFTNVASVEIETALGSIPGYPHFIGTIDSFVFRYVIKPFAHQLKLPPLKLIPPASVRGLYSDGLTIKVGKTRINLFDANFVGYVNGRSVLSVTSPWGGRATPSLEDTDVILKAKRELWFKRGWISHSDSTWIAAKILRNATVGPNALKALSARFPFIVVDELQDTGWFLGDIVRSFISQEEVRGLLVGDPDQAIYEFNGARPDLFDAFSLIPGAETYIIPFTRRCAGEVCAAAKHLSQSGADLPRQVPAVGRATILLYSQPIDEIGSVREKLKLRKTDGKQAVVTRRNRDVRDLCKVELPETPEFASVPIKFLHSAVNLLILSDMHRALARAQAALIYPVMGQPFPSEMQLQGRGINIETFRTEAIALLLAAQISGDETVSDWALRMKGVIDTTLDRNGWLDPKGKAAKARAPSKTLTMKRATTLARRPGAEGLAEIEIQTVHAVKGETHSTTLLYIPEAKNEKTCPSAVWWSSDPAHQEERRIAFVAATRPTTELILAMSKATFERLKAKQAAFVEAFQVKSVEQFLAE